MRYVAAVVVFALGPIILKSEPGPIIPYLRKHAKNGGDFASGLAVAMTVRRILSIPGMILGIGFLLKG